MRHYRLHNVETDPVFAMVKSLRFEREGSVTLDVDPISPDTEGTIDYDCTTFTWSQPSGPYCPINVTKRSRKVTLLPGGTAAFFGDPMPASALTRYLATFDDFSRDAVVRLTLDAGDYATSVEVVQVGQSQTSPWAAGAADLAADFEGAQSWLCGRDPSSLPSLAGDAADPYAVSVVQLLIPDGLAGVPVDGRLKSASVAIIKGWQSATGLSADGAIDRDDWLALQAWVCDWPEDNVQDTEPETVQSLAPDLVTVPRFVGARNLVARDEAPRYGLSVHVVGYTSGNPSMSAVVQGKCIVAQQAPAPGTQVERGSIVNVRIKCPQTGYDTGGAMGYDGPAPPDAWTGQ